MLRWLIGHLQRLFCQIIYQPNSRQLKTILRTIPEVTKVREDKSGDLEIKINNFAGTNLLLKIINHNLIFVAIFEVPKQLEVETLLATIIWNDDKVISHNTFAYVTLKSKCVLESHLSFQGGVTKPHLFNWFQNFVDKVPHFQKMLKITIQQLAENASNENNYLFSEDQSKPTSDVIGLVNTIPGIIEIIAELLSN